MKLPFPSRVVTVTVAVAVLVGVAGVGHAQEAALRTEWGAPDLRGVWNHGTATPLERPAQHAGRALLSEAEVADVNAAARSTEGVGARRAVWWERGLSDGRTSLIVDPPDGRIPYTPGARARRAALAGPRLDGPEDRSLAERCISYGIPRFGGPYSQNIHIAQTPDHVLLLFEMVHEFRIVPLDDRPPGPPTVRQWLGDARGRWEGDSLVVETVNFHAGQRYRGVPMLATRLVERFTRTDADTLQYAVTFHDATVWTQPWTVSLPLARTPGPMFEFACHEGNVGMTAMLETARRAEAQTASGNAVR